MAALRPTLGAVLTLCTARFAAARLAGQALGMINRNHFISTLARPFHRETFGRKPRPAFMGTKRLVVGCHQPLGEPSFVA